MKRVLIITYYWPPSAGSGVQRWVKFTKYLPEFGWQPVIFTPENPDFGLLDPSLEKEVSPSTEVLKFPIWEPYQLFRHFKGKNLKDTSVILERKDPSLLDRLAVWMRGNLLIPDPRIFWVRPSVKFLADICEQNNFSAIITTGPPHSMHLIGRGLKRKTGLPWLADFRDPWSSWEFLDTLNLTSIARRYHQKLERTVFREADALCTISPTFKAEMETLSGKNVQLLTNGFDPDDLPKNFAPVSPAKKVLEIVYSGVIDSIRDPVPFLMGMKKIYGQDRGKIRLTLVGKVNQYVMKLIREDPWLNAHVYLPGYVSHKEVFEFYERAHALLLILTDTKNAKGNIPGKLFEYMATGRPIIALGDPQGDAAQIIYQAGAGEVFRHDDEAGLIRGLSEIAESSSEKGSNEYIQAYSRKNLTRDLVNLLEKAIEG
ncbi:glycosyltransferase family 4 protein [Cyclobacterium plantarum]|uniref:Glycosyltransferase family 4 protein n=1 Tax=Cyclobacterium plantarum TaxID=2716263 RepID=A0ABX0H4S2_9BACT|nr:glycosyltransferase family 4 protein [Cyclobacterium plantarum]NHE55868.1 glycosyltransferase family 4 protein [Cyclobacterium plantarum]